MNTSDKAIDEMMKCVAQYAKENNPGLLGRIPIQTYRALLQIALKHYQI